MKTTLLIGVLSLVASFTVGCGASAPTTEAFAPLAGTRAAPPTDGELSFEPTQPRGSHDSSESVSHIAAPNRPDRSGERLTAAR